MFLIDMTQQEIETLKVGRESDSIIGLALGLIHRYEPSSNGDCRICGGIKIHHHHSGYGPRFTEDMNDAMVLVSKIKNLKTQYSQPFTMMYSFTKWTVGWFMDQDFGLCADDESLPLAICKAALLITDACAQKSS
jgi:hypothetical protein